MNGSKRMTGQDGIHYNLVRPSSGSRKTMGLNALFVWSEMVPFLVIVAVDRPGLMLVFCLIRWVRVGDALAL
jgi:hypothetical protein